MTATNNRTTKITAILIALSSYVFAANLYAGVCDLRCDYRDKPLAIDHDNPLLSWRLEGDRQGLAQTAYQIQAATVQERFDIPDLWDTGWVEDARSHAIAYEGKPPAAKQRVYWRVRFKDDRGEILPWSEITWFDAGLLTDQDWQGATWISCDREQQDEYGPADVMGDWIAASKYASEADTVTYRHDFSLPNKKVVYAGTWWSHVDEGAISVLVNGTKGLSGPEGPPTVHYKDLGFQMKADNTIVVTLTGAKKSTPISFGMRVVFADGSEQIIGTSGDWVVEIDGESMRAKVVCKYGQRPLGQAKISPHAPLAATWYKKDFNASKEVAAAKLYVCGLGYHEPYLNGTKVGDHVLDPGQTDYERFAHYQTFDISDQVKAGDNAIAVLLGDGWYNNTRMFSHARFRYGKPGLRAYIDIRYTDGTHQQVISDGSWHWKESGLTESSVFRGDYIDYRKWHDEWKTPGTPDGWKPVQKVKPLSPKLVAQDFPPIRIVREIDPVKTWQVGAKTWVVDLGQNISGGIGLQFNEPSGTVIRLRCSEMLAEDNTHLDNVPKSHWNCHAAPQHHRIIADGKPHQWRPYFSYHGFRYAEITGLSKPPSPGQIKGLVVHTDTPVIATFSSSDPLLDRIFQMGVQTHLNNMHSILEDCPHREKCLWGGDLHSSWATGLYTLDSGSFYRQQARLFYTPPMDPLGIPGRIGVGKRSTRKTLDFTWSVSPLFTAWHHYQLSGDLGSAIDHYQEMRDFLRFFEKKSPQLIPHIYRYGDHAPPIGIERTPADPQLIAALNFYAAADRFADLAAALGNPKDAKWSRDLAKHIAKSVVNRYYDEEQNTFGNGTHDSLALSFGIVDASKRPALAASLEKVYRENGKQFDGGFMSYNIYPELTKSGNVDLALEMLRNPEYPGIAQSIRDYDATTIFERFRNDSRSRQLVQSLDHHAMNHPSAWLLNDIAGIQSHPDHPGMRQLLLAPHIPTDLDHASGTLRTSYGTVKSKWKKKGGSVNWQIEIPPNCVAETRLPDPITNLRVNGETVGHTQSFNLKAGQHELEWTASKPVMRFEKTGANAEAPEGFVCVFNGTNLEGWKGGDEWSVEDGALTGVADGTLTANRFIVWQGEPLKNFELQVMVRVSAEGNSGLQYRGKVRPDLGPYRVSGYQCDIVAKQPAYNGMLYEEQGRRILARQGKTVVIDAEGQPWITQSKPAVSFAPDQWHRYRILAEGNHLRHWIDDQKTVDVIDLDESGRALEGVLAVQVHVGPPMKIQFKDFYLKRLPDDLPLVESESSKIPDDAIQVKPQGRLPTNWKPVAYAQRAKLKKRQERLKRNQTKP
ncbi:family 78 glycoside hydrolase catalytic domain [Rhodopirellula sallentina]|nr:family 78 glycoside hydrolase catalytic domain [Rhodopirellula sallentina]